MVLRDTAYLPWWMGGQNTTLESYNALFADSPFTPYTPGVFNYFLYTTGYHFGGFVVHLIVNREANDFHEMLLHHIATLALMTGSFLSNFMAIGACIAWLHDIGQVPLQLSKVLSATTYAKSTIAVFAVTLLLWVVTRLCWFAFFIFSTYTLDPTEETGRDAPLTLCIRANAIYLTTLYLLHIYWFCLMLRIAKGATQGRTDDLQNKVQSEKRDDHY